MSKIDIIIPVYNEDKIIIRLLTEFQKVINYDYNVFICYDNENDSTLNVINNSTLNKSRLYFIKNKKKGPNEAILTGLEQTSSDVILVYMADDFLNISMINDMYLKIKNGYDLIIPSRFVNGGTFENKNFFKKIITILGYAAMVHIAGIPYKDCTNAFKMFSSKILKKINLKSSKGFTYALELTIKAHHFKFNIIELPSKWKEIAGRKSNFKVISWLPYYIFWLLYAILLRIKII